MCGVNLSQRKMCDNQLVLALPSGHIGVEFSKTIPCEICRIDDSSPIYDSLYKFLGRVAYHLSIPDKVDIYGAIDRVTLEMILMAYSEIPNRTLMFVNRKDGFINGLVTTTILPEGPVTALFHASKKLFTSRARVEVARAGNNNGFEFPVGHYVEKVIIPNQLILKGGIRTTNRLRQILDHYENVPGRKIVFQKKIPKGGILTKVTIPRGSIGVTFHPDDGDVLCLPVVSIGMDSSIWQLNVGHVVEKLIVPNEITIERMDCSSFEKVLSDFSHVEGRVIVLQEFHKNIPTAGTVITITLPTGHLGLALKTESDCISVLNVAEDSQIKEKVPSGYYVQSLTIPGVTQLRGKDELMNATCLTETLNQFSHVPDRIMVLLEYKEDLKKKNDGKHFEAEYV